VVLPVRSEETCSVIHPAGRERACVAASGIQVGKDGFRPVARGQAAGTLSALLTVDPLKQDV
jgi:hypothetical protein